MAILRRFQWYMNKIDIIPFSTVQKNGKNYGAELLDENVQLLLEGLKYTIYI